MPDQLKPEHPLTPKPDQDSRPLPAPEFTPPTIDPNLAPDQVVWIGPNTPQPQHDENATLMSEQPNPEQPASQPQPDQPDPGSAPVEYPLPEVDPNLMPDEVRRIDPDRIERR
jgi:hypothetical protein